MKKLFPFLAILIVCVQSCVIRIINEPSKPPCPPPGGQPWWYSQIDQPNNGCDTVTTTDNDDNKRISTTQNEEDSIFGITPTTRYDSTTIDGVLTFNVYLGWNINQMETIVLLRDFPKEGGEIIFNIYTNNLSMSMYGFEKYHATDFYWFSNEPPYCGYSSYSLDTKPICRYKMVIRENDTNSDRFCNGYWACNNGGGFYTSFKIGLYQRF